MGYDSNDMIRLPLRDNPTGMGMMLSVLAMLALGVVMVHSAVASVIQPGPWYSRLDVRHTVFAILAMGVLCCGWLFDYRRLAGRDLPVRSGAKRSATGRMTSGFPVVAAVLLAVAAIFCVLVFVPGIGHKINGKFRWIRFGPRQYSIGFQPSEILKLSLMVFLAAFLARRGGQVRSFRKTLLPVLLVSAVCIALVVTQDFGTAAVMGLSVLALLMLAGVRWYYLFTLIVAGAGAGYLFVTHSAYRMARIAAMLDPWATGNPSAYQPRQSLLSILTGGYTGQGVGHGMLKRGFLPEAPTDFIFATYCEEWGLAGAMLLMGLILLWLWHARRATSHAPNEFGYLLCGSLGFLIGLQAVLHIAVTLVAAPPTGMGLPFISAGGTSLVTMAAAAALMISVTARRRT